VKEIPANSLPAVSDPIPNLDGGRIDVAPPEGWKFLPRSSDYVIRFYQSDPNGLPRIEITGEDWGQGNVMRTVSRENVEQFAQLIDAELKKAGKELIEPVLPMVIADTPCARYVRGITLQYRRDGKVSNMFAERQVLLTLYNGRLYTIDLRVLPQTLLQYRDYGYAVCGGLKFHEAGGTEEQAVEQVLGVEASTENAGDDSEPAPPDAK
jgi:hypothetical protein